MVLMANTYYKSRTAAYVAGQSEPFKVSRSKIELFVQCPRCFWLDARLPRRPARSSGPAPPAAAGGA